MGEREKERGSQRKKGGKEGRREGEEKVPSLPNFRVCVSVCVRA